MEHKLLRPADLVLLLVAAAAAAVLLFWQSAQAQGNCVAVIEENGVELERVDLSSLTEATEIDLGGDYSVVLLAEPGKISFLHSSCPDQTCVRTGELTKPGQAAVCLPARISVRLEGTASGADAMTG